MVKRQSFKGDKKEPIKTLTRKFEDFVIKKSVPKVPIFLETNHLTNLTILWSFGVLVFGFLAITNYFWLIGSCIMIALQWYTDCLDGSVGRYRKTGLVKWGFFMDHFLDYIFLCCIMISYFFLLNSIYNKMLLGVLMIIFAGFMVQSFLYFATTGKFKISHYGFGPTEIRIGFILLNILIIIFGTNFIEVSLLYFVILCGAILAYMVYTTGKKLWKQDMINKKIIKKSKRKS